MSQIRCACSPCLGNRFLAITQLFMGSYLSISHKKSKLPCFCFFTFCGKMDVATGHPGGLWTQNPTKKLANWVDHWMDHWVDHWVGPLSGPSGSTAISNSCFSTFLRANYPSPLEELKKLNYSRNPVYRASWGDNGTCTVDQGIMSIPVNRVLSTLLLTVNGSLAGRRGLRSISMLHCF